MKLINTQKSRSLKVAALPLLVIAAGLCGQVALAGGNGSGQPSGSTVAGSTTTPTATMSGQTSVILAGGATTTTETTPTSGGGTTTTITTSLPASTVVNTLSQAGINHDPNSTVAYVGQSGTTYLVSPDIQPTTVNSNGTFLLTQTSGVRIKVKAQLFATR